MALLVLLGVALIIDCSITVSIFGIGLGEAVAATPAAKDFDLLGGEALVAVTAVAYLHAANTSYGIAGLPSG
jgi:hypothetical protein